MNNTRQPMLRRSNMPREPQPEFYVRDVGGQQPYIVGVRNGPCALVSGTTVNEALDRAREFFAQNYRWAPLSGQWEPRR
jgi:hypothetical protein